MGLARSQNWLFFRIKVVDLGCRAKDNWKEISFDETHTRFNFRERWSKRRWTTIERKQRGTCRSRAERKQTRVAKPEEGGRESFSEHVMALLRALSWPLKSSIYVDSLLRPGEGEPNPSPPPPFALFTEWPPNPFAAIREGLSINPHFHSPASTRPKRKTKGRKDVATWILSSFRLHNLQLKVYWLPLPLFSLSLSCRKLFFQLPRFFFLYVSERRDCRPAGRVICIMQ